MRGKTQAATFEGTAGREVAALPTGDLIFHRRGARQERASAQAQACIWHTQETASEAVAVGVPRALAAPAKANNLRSRGASPDGAPAGVVSRSTGVNRDKEYQLGRRGARANAHAWEQRDSSETWHCVRGDSVPPPTSGSRRSADGDGAIVRQSRSLSPQSNLPLVTSGGVAPVARRKPKPVGAARGETMQKIVSAAPVSPRLQKEGRTLMFSELQRASGWTPGDRPPPLPVRSPGGSLLAQVDDASPDKAASPVTPATEPLDLCWTGTPEGNLESSPALLIASSPSGSALRLHGNLRDRSLDGDLPSYIVRGKRKLADHKLRSHFVDVGTACEDKGEHGWSHSRGISSEKEVLLRGPGNGFGRRLIEDAPKHDHFAHPGVAGQDEGGNQRRACKDPIAAAGGRPECRSRAHKPVLDHFLHHGVSSPEPQVPLAVRAHAERTLNAATDEADTASSANQRGFSPTARHAAVCREYALAAVAARRELFAQTPTPKEKRTGGGSPEPSASPPKPIQDLHSFPQRKKGSPLNSVPSGSWLRWSQQSAENRAVDTTAREQQAGVSGRMLTMPSAGLGATEELEARRGTASRYEVGGAGRRHLHSSGGREAPFV